VFSPCLTPLAQKIVNVYIQASQTGFQLLK